MAKRAAKEAAEDAIESIGLGYDLTDDLKLKYCKRQNSATARDSRLINIMDHDKVQDMVIPGGEILIPNVPKSIKCDKGERTRFSSDVVSFQQMSELFNQELSLSGKIPSGHLNTAFEFTGVWQKDAANTKTLAFDGVFITLYNIALQKSNLLLRHHVKQAVPSSWDPAALASFIEKYGTHVVVGVKMGGKDVIYVKQQHSSPLQPVDVQKKLKDMADKRFTDGARQYDINSDRFYERKKVLQILEGPWIALESGLHGERRSAIGKRHRSLIEHGLTLMDHLPTSSYSHTELQDIKFMSKRKGGYLNKNSTHKEWCHSVQFDPDVISMSFIPITSLLSGIHGSGFLSHAINLYLRYKPPIEELLQFLEFQLPRQWAPVFGELALGPQRKQQSTASLQFGFMGPKLYVNTTPVDVGKMPVTGLRLYLEGNKSNCLAIHLQHLSSLPKTFQLEDELNNNVSQRTSNHRYYEKIQWKSFSHACTAPVESDEDFSIVTGAHFEVEDSGLKKILFLRLHFSKVIGAMAVRRPEWDGSPGLAQKSGLISTLMSTHFSTGQKPSPQPADVNINSALYPGGPPLPTQTPKLLRFVDTTEMTRGAQDSPGYWVVSGARLFVEKGKISLKVKFSLLTVILPDEEMPPEC